MTTKKNNARTSEILEKWKAFVEKCQKNFWKWIIIWLTAFSLSGILTSCESSVEELKNNPTYTKKLTENSSVRKQIQKCQDLWENIGAKLTKAYCDNPTHETDSFVLWVLDDRTISLTDLAWWGDDQTNVMIDGDWKFILYQHSDSYRAKSIRISQAKY